MKKMIIALLLLGIAVGGYLYYRHISTGPEYSLMQAAKAVHDRDPAAFERYVDVSSVTSSLVDDITEQGSVLGMLNPGGFALKGALRLLKPQLAQAARQEVQRYVETGSVEAAASVPKPIGNVSLLGLAGKVVSKDSQFKGIKYTKEEGEQALVGLEFTQPRYDTTLVLEVKMLNKGDYWQATEITNTAAILQHVTRMEKQHLLGGQ
ncbi:hypothetical protein HNQ93_003974 [Hymenobacter luteus]|uniref:DUF2939 domain-containing protein n=2 Tax=Hymenobacter TaxID=89966 RepID=A0A7W9T3U2_9BACT|nr:MULTISPECIES: DUF2939 domain-containing protein [Hymenobacter]MBB4603346.1 hypothetical protein [Hymenobacter latericoloratus]MBB6061096.1 hypothetical protein [Hymenobacter luteus]